MLVKELIEELKKFPKDWEVGYYYHEVPLDTGWHPVKELDRTMGFAKVEIFLEGER